MKAVNVRTCRIKDVDGHSKIMHNLFLMVLLAFTRSDHHIKHRTCLVLS